MPLMSDMVKLSLLRMVMILVTIIGAVYVFGVINNVRQGDAEFYQIILGVAVVVALVWMNRWWFRKSGTRL
jgi:hypothetical protein